MCNTTYMKHGCYNLEGCIRVAVSAVMHIGTLECHIRMVMSKALIYCEIFLGTSCKSTDWIYNILWRGCWFISPCVHTGKKDTCSFQIQRLAVCTGRCTKGICYITEDLIVAKVDAWSIVWCSCLDICYRHLYHTARICRIAVQLGFEPGTDLWIHAFSIIETEWLGIMGRDNTGSYMHAASQIRCIINTYYGQTSICVNKLISNCQIFWHTIRIKFQIHTIVHFSCQTDISIRCRGIQFLCCYLGRHWILRCGIVADKHIQTADCVSVSHGKLQNLSVIHASHTVRKACSAINGCRYKIVVNAVIISIVEYSYGCGSCQQV